MTDPCLIYSFNLMSQCAYVSRDFRITTDRVAGHTLRRRDRWATDFTAERLILPFPIFITGIVSG